jgi:hypothetical protein
LLTVTVYFVVLEVGEEGKRGCCKLIVVLY